MSTEDELGEFTRRSRREWPEAMKGLLKAKAVNAALIYGALPNEMRALSFADENIADLQTILLEVNFVKIHLLDIGEVECIVFDVSNTQIWFEMFSCEILRCTLTPEEYIPYRVHRRPTPTCGKIRQISSVGGRRLLILTRPTRFRPATTAFSEDAFEQN